MLSADVHLDSGWPATLGSETTTQVGVSVVVFDPTVDNPCKRVGPDQLTFAERCRCLEGDFHWDFGHESCRAYQSCISVYSVECMIDFSGCQGAANT
jgi:hypothetical protein